jgi:hypothetical protein
MNFRSKGLSSVLFDIARFNHSKGGNDDRNRASNADERPLDGFGKNGGGAGQPVADHPVGHTAKPDRLSDRACLEFDEIQTGKRVHVGRLQPTDPFEHETENA